MSVEKQKPIPNRSSHSEQLQQEETARWTNQNSQQITRTLLKAREKALVLGATFFLVSPLIGGKTRANF